MTVDERTRRDLYTAFEATWGPERAEALMSLLPPVGWGDVATRRDLEVFAERVDGRVTADIATMRTEMAELRTELRTEMAELRTELRTDMADLRTDFHRDLATATRTMVLSLTSSVFVVGSLAFGAARLL